LSKLGFSGESMATTPSPLEQLANEINALQTRVNWMQDSVRLKSILDEVEDLQTNVNGMAQRVKELRTRGYVFEKDLEGQATNFAQQWEKLRSGVTSQLSLQTLTLQNSLHRLENKLSQLNGLRSNPGMARPLLVGAQAELEALESEVRSAENTMRGAYDAFKREVESVKYHLGQIDYALTQVAEAKFTLLPTEGVIMAIKAVWCQAVKEQKDDPEGVLYLTDQRLLFERKEEVATKKILFITTEKQKVQELKWEVPVALMGEVKATKEGLLKNEDHLDLRFGTGAALGSAHLHIWQEANEWLQLINRAKTHDFDQTRAVAIDQAEVEKVKAAPAQCPACGGNLNQVILRGQDNVKCEYCGFVIRL
jgi:HAMP domain-containing protein